MDFELTDEQRLIQDTVRDFVDERVLPNAIENDINHHLAWASSRAWPSWACSGS
jgi:alkylation response protein AidB-like acyl-CoA dehydrogenase